MLKFWSDALSLSPTCSSKVHISSCVFLDPCLRNLVSEGDGFQYEIYSYLVPECATRTDDNLVNMEDVCFACFFFALIIHTQTHTHTVTVATVPTEKPHRRLILAKSCLGSLVINTQTHTYQHTSPSLGIKAHWRPLFLLPLFLIPVISSFRVSSVLLWKDFPSDGNSSTSNIERPTN